MSELGYDEADAELRRALPELEESYEAELAWWDGDASPKHVIYGNVLNPFLLGALERNDADALRRAFDFVERLASASEERLVNVVMWTVCERLGDDAAKLATARQWMGPRTLELSRQVEAFWGRSTS